MVIPIAAPAADTVVIAVLADVVEPVIPVGTAGTTPPGAAGPIEA
jgi:hypothetical protein